MARLELKKCPYCGSEVDTVSVKEKDGNLCIEVKTKNSWIPCSERLPEDFSWCLVCMADGFIRLGRWNAKYDDTGAWQVLMKNGDKMYRIKTVPHWMPLPEPPESEVRDDA